MPTQRFAEIADFSALGLPPKALEGISNADKEKHLDAASAKAAGFLRSKFKLPLASWDEALTEAVASIAAFGLMGVRGYNPAAGANEVIEKRHDKAMAWLKEVARGVVVLDYQDSSGTSTTPRRGPMFAQLHSGGRTVGNPRNRGW
jgi:phage gp36-like protein